MRAFAVSRTSAYAFEFEFKIQGTSYGFDARLSALARARRALVRAFLGAPPARTTGFSLPLGEEVSSTKPLRPPDLWTPKDPLYRKTRTVQRGWVPQERRPMEYATCFPIVTDQDHARLSALIEATNSSDKERLRNELARAHIVPQSIVPPDIVTMHSVVTFEEEDSGRRSQVALVYPQNADASVGRVSILEPLGISLLGVRVGHTAKWTAPNGKLKKIKVIAISFQPEALGAYEL